LKEKLHASLEIYIKNKVLEDEGLKAAIDCSSLLVEILS
jgi:hypothetical protein